MTSTAFSPALIGFVLLGLSVSNDASAAPGNSPARPGTAPTPPTSGPATTANVPAASRAPNPQRAARGAELIAEDRRYLVLPSMAGCPLATVDTKTDVSATYDPRQVGAGTLLFYASRNDETLQSAEPGGKPATVADHPAMATDDRKAHETALTWRSGPWMLSVTFSYETPALHDKAMQAVSRAAKEAADWTDRFTLGVGMLPDSNERRAHLDALNTALDKAAEARARKAIDAMTKKLRAAGVGSLIDHLGLHGDPNELIVTVRPEWLDSSKPERLEAAKSLWKLWAKINSPSDPDKSRIKLTNVNGTDLGGSGWGGGSISVE